MIDKERLLKAMEFCRDHVSCKGCPYDDECGIRDHAIEDDALALLREQKSVVLCGDCKYWNAGTCLNDKVSWQIDDCGCYPDFVTDSDWFCAEGERK